MFNRIILALVVVVLGPLMVSGQSSPHLMSYQSILRNASNQLVVNASVGVRVSILQGSPTGAVVYSEVYQPNPSTNANGLLGFNIGSGMPSVGLFAQINWSQGPYFVRVEADPNGGTNYFITSVSQLLSVPYALHARTADVPGLPGPQGPQGAVGPAGPQGPIGQTGPAGPQGVPGNDGAVGPQGPQGTQGPIGLTGPAGPAGSDGAVGPQGIQGVQGPVGSPGPQGSTGASGVGVTQTQVIGDSLFITLSNGLLLNAGHVRGLQGVPGSQGPIGLPGPAGPQGVQGIPGNDGAVGPQGLIGLTGPQGPQGVPGNDGATGPQGPIGLTGPQGPAGSVGPTGPQGPAGSDGAVGPQGPIGLPGPAGPQGVQGIPGSDGAVGPQGPIGLTGPQGPQGPAGSDGAVGPQGPIGLTGPQGPQGPAGSDGAVGPQGPIGLTGPTGPQGSFPSGTQPGEMNYWNGTAWVSVPPGTNGQVLTFCNGVPSWNGCFPSVITTPVSNITSNSIATGGNVVSQGLSSVTARGVAYGTVTNPTTLNNTTSNGAGTGVFITNLIGLLHSTTYYVRAYATNSVGTAYGNEVGFTTLSASTFTCGTSTVSDVDNNTYTTVQIGTQCWTRSNLKVSKYRNGDNIPTGLSDGQWGSTTSGAYALYNNDPVNDGLYGKLYNWYTVNDTRGLCPTGWHVPSDGEWTTLTDFLGGLSVAGGKMKSTAIQPTPGGWNAPNTGATNSSGFSGLPGGDRASGGGFVNLGYGTWWSSSVAGSGGAWYRNLRYDGADAGRSSHDHRLGFSVRCVKDSLSGGGSASVPTVSTTSATSITSTGATTGGNVTADGGTSVTARGVAYGTVQNPTTANSTTSNGTGIGSFTSTLSGLTASTLYYVRAYATNSVGTAYGNEVSFTTNLTIGSNYAGGIVFYVDSTGQHGLVCASSDQLTSQWGCFGTNISGTSTAFGTGMANTMAIVNGCSQRPIAASVCNDLVLNGYDDWYLPSRDELSMMYNSLRTQNLGNFQNSWYWSSSQSSSGNAWSMNLSNGNTSDYFSLGGKSLNFPLRAVRAF